MELQSDCMAVEKKFKLYNSSKEQPFACATNQRRADISNEKGKNKSCQKCSPLGILKNDVAESTTIFCVMVLDLGLAKTIVLAYLNNVSEGNPLPPNFQRTFTAFQAISMKFLAKELRILMGLQGLPQCYSSALFFVSREQ
mmetsp:Transcript_133919/g.250520  ORF Transcript_133919/g.250520 Transcript_133919/m.250520 type:complete len:141 (-) Transcript_133919:1076-1498(-)